MYRQVIFLDYSISIFRSVNMRSKLELFHRFKWQSDKFSIWNYHF